MIITIFLNRVIMMRTLKELKEKHFTKVYQFEAKKKQWQLKGYHCTRCERIVKFESTIDKHSENCPKKNPKVYGVDPTPEILLDINGNNWKPFTETNHY